MKFSIKKDKLNEIIDLCLRFVSKSSTLPILENIYIKADEDWIVFKSTDMEKYMSFVVPQQASSYGTITVNWRLISDIIKNIDAPVVDIVMQEDSETMFLKTEEDEFTVKWIPSSEYVAIPEIEWIDNISFSAKDFDLWISKVEYAITERNFSPVLTWMLIRLNSEESNSTLSFVWTDSFRLAEYKISLDNVGKNFDLIVPKTNINEVKKIIEYYIEKWWQDFKISFSENLVSFEFCLDDFQIYVTSVLIQWNFPDYNNESIIPTKFATNCQIKKDDFEKAIKKVSVFTKDINHFIDLKISNWLVDVDSGNTDKWQAQTKLSANVSWEDVSFGINWKYILDFIKQAEESEEIWLNVVDNQKPIVFSDLSDTKITYIIRPLIQ